MKIINKIFVCLTVLTSIVSNAQNVVRENKTIQGKELFNNIDVDKDGKILLDEIRIYYNNMVNWKDEPIRADMRFNAYDRDENQIVTLDEINKGLDWTEFSRRKAAKRRNKIVQQQSYTPPVVKSTAPDVIAEIENTTVNVTDVESTLQNNTTGGDPDIVDEELSLEDFKNRFINKRRKQNSVPVQPKTRRVNTSEYPRFMLIGSKISKEQATIRLNKIDTNFDGYVDLPEMSKFYKGKVNPWGKRINSKAWFYGYDADMNDKIDVNEFQNGVNWKLSKSKRNM